MLKFLLLTFLVTTAPAAQKIFPFSPQTFQSYSDLQFTWWTLNIYKVELWTADGKFPDFQKPLIMHYEYQKNIKAKALVDTSIEEWQRLKSCTDKQAQMWAKQLLKIWPDIKSGDTLTAWFDGKETHFYQEKKFLGSIKDQNFTRPFFSIWLHPKSKTAKLRNKRK